MIASHGLGNHHWQQLLAELPEVIVVAATVEHHRQVIAVVPSFHLVDAGGLADRTGPARVAGGGFRESAGGAEGTDHPAGADVTEAEPRFVFR